MLPWSSDVGGPSHRQQVTDDREGQAVTVLVHPRLEPQPFEGLSRNVVHLVAQTTELVADLIHVGVRFGQPALGLRDIAPLAAVCGPILLVRITVRTEAFENGAPRSLLTARNLLSNI